VTPEVEREITYDPGDAVYVENTPADMPRRQHIARLLANVPTFVYAVHKLRTGNVFRVVISKANAHLFKRGVDGVYKPFLHNGKHFVEDVDLVRASPDYLCAVSNVALMVTNPSGKYVADRVKTRR
jgi:hypothetical protein